MVQIVDLALSLWVVVGLCMCPVNAIKMKLVVTGKIKRIPKIGQRSPIKQVNNFKLRYCAYVIFAL